PESGAAGREPLGRDLDAILLQALRKEPERRYASVDLFAEDIRRYLGGLPVTARGDALGYRAGKFVRRHRLEVAAAALLALTLVGATAFSLREAHIAEEQRARAERHFADVRGLANTLLFQVHDAIKDLPGATKAREQLVGTALEYLGRLSAEAGDDRRLREELAAAYEKVGDIQGQAYGAATAGEPKAALESYSRAIALLEPIVAAEPAAHAARGALARNLLRKSRLLLLLDESAEAASFSGRAVETSEALVRDAPDDAARKMLADAYTAHAYTADLTGGQDGAGVAFARKSIAILEDLESRNPDDLDAAYRLATAYSSLAITLVGKDARPEVLEESLGYYRKAVVLDERLVAATAGKNAKYSRGLLLDRFNMAFILNEQGDYRGALQNARKAQALLPDLRADAENKQARIDSANLAWPLGRALLALGLADEAEDVFRQAYEELESMVNETDTLKVHYLLGMNAFGLGEVHVHRADAARASPGTRRAELLAAKRWYGVATPHFQRVTAGVTLDSMDMKPVDGAAAGLARVEAELAKPGGGGPG
ncbi:MAG TPA: hypothetical protein VFM30_09425, partial [Steroidobacteraceae bacterium]|nr:hypothetical protein [Steroidobacteraceae bacterium]